MVRTFIVRILFLFIFSVFLYGQENDNIEEVVTVGTKASLKSAIDKQRDSDQIVSIVDSDALGEFPDETAAEAVRRLSGVNVENDQGEGRYITLRGMSGDLNAVSMNGALVPAPEGGRKVLLDGLPTELLDSIEVFKSLVPSQDAEGIGGRIEFKTKRATELVRTLFKFKYDGTYNEFVDDFDSPKYSLTYGNKFSDNFGLILGYTYQDKHIISNNNETGYEPWAFLDNGNKYLARDWELRYYDLTRNREGITIDFDLIIDDSSSAYINYLSNQYTDNEVRHKDEFRARDVLESSVTSNSASYQRITSDKETRKRIEVRQIETKILGYEKYAGDYLIKLQSSESFAEEDDSNNVDAKFRAECRIRSGDEICGTYSWANPKLINLAIAPAGSMLSDPSEYDWDEFEIDYGLIQDREFAHKVDFINENLEINGSPIVVEFGAKSSRRIKSNQAGNYDATDDVQAGLINYRPYAPNNYWYLPQQLSFFANPNSVFSLQNQVRPNLELDFGEFWRTQEKINAVYFMGTIKNANSVLVAGVRNESTIFETSGYNNGDVNDPLNFKNTYNFLAPSFNYKHFIGTNAQLRFAFYRSLSRPGFEQSAPVAEISENEGGNEFSGSMGNPDLKAYEADNIDFALEFYGNDYYLTVGTFIKQIENTIYPRVLSNQSIGGISFSRLETFANAGNSSIIGFEFNVFSEFNRFVPVEGFFIAANLTLSDGESKFSPGGDNLNTYTIPFRKLSEENANISIGYDRGKIDARLAVNYRSSYLDYLGDDGEELFNDDFGYGFIRFTDDYYSVDFTAKYKVTDQLSLRFDAKNIGNQPEFYYWNSADRLSQYDEYGSSMSVGFRYNF